MIVAGAPARRPYPGRPHTCADALRVEGVSAPSSGPDPSQLRIGDTERNSAMDALSEHLGKGRIDLDEFGTRSAQVTQARTVADLRALFADLPPPHPTLPEPAGPVAAGGIRPAVPSAAAPARPDDGRTPAQRAVAVLIAASGILSLILFFLLKTWIVFLIPALIAVVSSALWGSDWRNRS